MLSSTEQCHYWQKLVNEGIYNEKGVGQGGKVTYTRSTLFPDEQEILNQIGPFFTVQNRIVQLTATDFTLAKEHLHGKASSVRCIPCDESQWIQWYPESVATCADIAYGLHVGSPL